MSEATIAARPVRATPPWVFALIVLQSGAYQGFITIPFAYIAAHNGMSVAAVGGIVGLVVAASAFKLLWTPVIDLFLTMKTWIVLGTLLSSMALLALVAIPFRPEYTTLLGLVALFGACASQTASAAGGGLLVLSVDKARLGTASGWWSGASLVAHGACGGAGLWLATNYGPWIAVGAIVAVCLGSLAVLTFVAEPVRPHLTDTLPGRLRAIGVDLWSVARSRLGLFVILLFATPIGVGGASYLWSAIASEWSAGSNTVALVTGFASACASGIGAMLFGRFAETYDRLAAFCFTGLLLVGAALFLAVMPRTPMVFVVGTLVYALLVGCAWTSFVALSFQVIEGGAAASKYTALNAVGNIPVAYMPVFLGWVHDRASTTAMLWTEVVVTLAVITVAWLADRFVVRGVRPGAIPATA